MAAHVLEPISKEAGNNSSNDIVNVFLPLTIT